MIKGDSETAEFHKYFQSSLYVCFLNWNTSFRDKGKNPYLNGLGAK